jgi:tRNA/rRNA methyltransferase
MSLHHCRVVLVRPTIAANLGATARAMRNFGLTDLVLVAPEADPADPHARQLSTHGEHLLQQARLVPDFDSAVADCVLVAGTSARLGGLFRRQSLATPGEIMPQLLDATASGPVALVFGPEPSGLSNAEVTRCHYLIHIPTDPSYPALNLAHAVAICLYELRKEWNRRADQQTAPPESFPVATVIEQERLFAHLRTALEEIHFLYGPKADSLMHALRHLLGKARLSTMEVEVLHGLARQIRWYVEHQRGEGSGNSAEY